MPLASLLAGRLHRGEYLLFGGQSELERLLGCPLPAFPRGEISSDGLENLWVSVHSELRNSFHACLVSLVDSVCAVKRSRSGDSRHHSSEYEAFLAETLGQVVVSDRRLGLTNLFWVAHSLQVAEVMEDYFRESGANPAIKYQIHPLLAGLYQRLEKGVVQGLGKAEERRLEFRRGVRCNRSLVDTVTNDQFSLTEADLRGFDPIKTLVPENRRFQIGADACEEMQKILRGRMEAAITGEDLQVVGMLSAVTGGVTPAECLRQGRLDRFSYQRPVVEGLLRDVEGVLNVVTRNRILKNEKERIGGWGHLFDAYLDFGDALLRSQIVCALRRSLVFSAKGFDDRETRDKFTEGSLYRFSRQGGIVNNVRKVTVLFADLRDFLRTSEGAISENDLTTQLYRIFDPAAMVISTFGGSIDKYLGDGFMGTFGVNRRDGGGNMAALRAAVAIQHMLAKLRKQAKTDFRMGISLHTGRVSVARFLLDPSREETTPIGRQVNIAGRLSSPKGLIVNSPSVGSRDPVPEGDTALADLPPPSDLVFLDAEGSLQNDGIAVSGAFLEELKDSPGLDSFHQEGSRGYLLRDSETSLTMRFDYVGEAGFKGFAGSISIFSLAGHVGKKSGK
jgi:class 3 adenylate cyclase